MPRIPLNPRDALSDPPYCLEDPNSLSEAELELLDAESDELQQGISPKPAQAPEPSPELKRLLQGDTPQQMLPPDLQVPTSGQQELSPGQPVQAPEPQPAPASQPMPAPQPVPYPEYQQASSPAPQLMPAPELQEVPLPGPDDCKLNDVLAARRRLVKRTTTEEVSMWAEEFTLGDPESDARRARHCPPLSDLDLSATDLDPRQERAILNALDLAAENQSDEPGPKDQAAQQADLAHSSGPSDEASEQELKLNGDQILARQARAAALEDLSLSKTLGLKRSEVMLNGLRSHLTWVLFSFGSLALSFFCLAALIAQSSRPALQPYVVTVDRQGVVLNRGPLTPASEALTPALVAAELSEFVRNVRMVTPDKTLQRELMTKAYALVAPNSKVFFDLDAYFNAHNPLSNKAPYAVTVDILNVIATGEHTVQIDWREQSHAGAADTMVSAPEEGYERTMRALVSFEQDSALTQGTAEGSERLLLLNPLGLIVTEFVVSDVMA